MKRYTETQLNLYDTSAIENGKTTTENGKTTTENGKSAIVDIFIAKDLDLVKSDRIYNRILTVFIQIDLTPDGFPFVAKFT